MKDTDYKKLLQFKNMKGSALIPHSPGAHEFLDYLKHDEIVTFKNVTARDIRLHGCYFALLAEVFGYLPVNLRTAIGKENFYNWLKMYQNKYKVIYEFQSGKQLVEYESISFGRMNNNKFKSYVKEQLIDIYDILIETLGSDLASAAIENIEESFERFYAKL